MVNVLRLKPGREKSLLRRHPWIYSGAIASQEGNLAAGETVAIQDSNGHFLAWGAYSPHSQIRARIWSWLETEQIDETFFRSRLAAALSARRDLLSDDRLEAIRLVYAESDALPGLIVDRYADVLVIQFLSSGVEHWREVLTDLLVELSGVANVYERSDVEVRYLEGLPERSGSLRGNPPESIRIQEAGLKFQVDLVKGHKTGFYLDQRWNRQRVRQLANGRQVLDCFCYTGGFALNALVGGAREVLAVDSSKEALAQGRENLALNGLPSSRVEWQEGDVFKVLRSLRDQGRQFDLIVLDPPKFAPTASQAMKAARGYKDINLLAIKLLRAGGLLATFSCSGGVDTVLFQKIVAGAAVDAGVQAQILERLTQDCDHPVGIHFPEGEYLKGLILRLSD
jgi:23S rRNA (cytosine1962-C5)-methyltransferase